MTHKISASLAHLKAFPQFVVCHFVPSATRPGKTDKIPVDPATGRNCSAMDQANWMTAEAAEAAAERLGQTYGVGFVLTPATKIFCLDIDGALQADNTWSPLALDLCARFPGAAVEVSQSGAGLHIWGTYEGDEPQHAKKNAALGLELYTADRFIALGGTATGEVQR